MFQRWCFNAFVLLSILLLYQEPIFGFVGKGRTSVERRLIIHARVRKTPTFSFLPNVTSTRVQMSKAKLEEAKEINDVNFNEDLLKSGLWLAISTAFCGLLSQLKGVDSAIEFASGYFLEQALSIDNLFVFILLFKLFKVPKQYEAKILGYGIIGAVILRGIFIVVGAAVLQRFHQIILVFAVLLGTASYGILFPPLGEKDDDLKDNAVVKFTQKFLKTTDKFLDGNFFIVENGESLATPLFLCLVCIELSDIVFAFDSVPAIFGITEDPLVVYTSNLFSIASLRALYGVLSTAVKEIEYLEKAVGIILAVIAAKLGFSTFDVEILTPVQSLITVITLLGGGVLLSAFKSWYQ